MTDETSAQTRELGSMLAVRSEGHEKQIEIWPPEERPFLQVIMYDEQGAAEVTNQRNAVLKAQTSHEADEWIECLNAS